MKRRVNPALACVVIWFIAALIVYLKLKRDTELVLTRTGTVIQLGQCTRSECAYTVRASDGTTLWFTGRPRAVGSPVTLETYKEGDQYYVKVK